MAEALKKPRPVYRNIHVLQIVRYRLPLAGKLSILNRISGAAMFLALPFVLYLFDRSLTSEATYDEFRSVVDHPFTKLVLLGLVWSFLHHLCAGVRYLILDLHVGLQKAQAARSAAIAFAVSLALTLVLGLMLFGAF